MTTATAIKPFDAVKYKETTREQWQAAARAWNDWGPLLRDWLGPATDIMLDMAAIGPGHRVLDVAAGAGDQTLQAAERVGPSGHVLATDISANHIRVVYLEIRWSHDISSEDDVPETRSKTLDLALNPFGHINFASVRDVTVRPTGMLPRWRARFIHHALLRNKNERVL